MDVNDIYTSVSEARLEIERRQKDINLKKKLELFWGDNKPDFLDKDKPKAVISKPIITPNLEFNYFVDIVNDFGFDFSCFEYLEGKFVGKNQEKKNLGKMCFRHGQAKNFNEIINYKNVVNFNTQEGKKLKEVETIFDNKLHDFHKILIEKSFPGKKINIQDISEWFDKTKNLDDYYVFYLSLFIRDHVLFENFLMNEKEESKFTFSKFLPSFKKVTEIFGVKPLIVPLLPFEIEKNSLWFSYDEGVEKNINKML